ncbi:MAG: ABC transporter ATP-binding protein [Deltaproteobacteria bacterium]|nr:ABC transporter ATP-binding protein [Deltaproteobacteria bacterium]
MADVAIKVDHLGKRFRIGAPQERYKTFRETITNAAAAPFRRLTAYLRSKSVDSEPDTIWALKDVSFEVKPGEVVGIIGRNGAGKSTLLKVLSRITEPTEGYAEVYGRIGSLLEVGTGFHPELTGRENIFLNGAILGMKKAEIDKKFDEIVAFAEVEKFIDTPVKHYSSGMYLRLAFAVAAHLEPEILLVDEVLAVGDMAFQKKCLGKMHEVSKAGRTVLFVSHNMSAIASLCPRSILLNAGDIFMDGPSSDVVSAYLSDATGRSTRMTWRDRSASPGEKGFKLDRVELVDHDGSQVKIVDVAKRIRLVLSYRVEQEGLKFRIAASFHTQGTCAFVTLQPEEVLHDVVGAYRASVEIGGNLLAEGDYSVSVSVFSSRGKKEHYCKVKDVVVFQVFDPLDGRSARGDYTEEFSGVVRPRLEWECAVCETRM